MATITAFNALRFTKKAGDIESLICPPYDIISDEGRKNYLSQNENNIIRLELPREGENPYETAGETLRRWLDAEILKADDKPALYIYEEEFEAGGTRRVKGFTCRVKLEEFLKGIILPHEETLSKAKADRFDLVKATSANFSSIYSLYFDGDNKVRPFIDGLSARTPEVEAKDGDGVIHRLWIVTDESAIENIVSLMADKKLYIADGHHRYETALNYREYLKSKGESVDNGHPADYIMMQLVNMEHEGLVVFPTHRVVTGLKNVDGAKLLSDCAKYFDILALSKEDALKQLKKLYDENRKAFMMYHNNEAHVLILKDEGVMKSLLPEKAAAYRSLDVAVLHTLILEKLLGVDKENMAAQKNLVYVRDENEAMQMVDDKNANLAFIINPTKVSEIAEVAGAGEKMPQKSTYFYPKLITGLVINRLNTNLDFNHD